MKQFYPSGLLAVFCLLVISSPSLFAQDARDPVANPKAVVQAGKARFTVLTDRMLRLEWQPDGQFQDRPSFVVVNRDLPVPYYGVSHAGGELTINTENLKLRYKENSGKFNSDNLSIQFQLHGQWHSWHPGMKDTANLKGTIRTLDGVKGAAKLPAGLLSRAGWHVIDDSGRPLFDDSDWPWVMPRTDKGQQDWYFMGYGHHYKEELGDFIKVAGRMPMPPRFAFGYWWSRYWAYSDQEFKDLVHQFHTHEVPLNVLVIDMDWHKTWGRNGKDQAGQPKGWTGYTWNPTYFPNPDKFLAWTKRQDLKVTMNLHPASGIQPYEAPYLEMAKAMGIDPSTKKYVPFNITDKIFAKNYFKYVIDPFEKQGVDFWWLDWQQWGNTKIPGVTPTWWLNYVFFTHMKREKDDRPLIYHRWGGLGNHRYEIGFSGDVVNTWKSLDFQPYFTSTASNVGYGYWSHDIGGHYPGPESPELFTRWIQWGAFSPIIRTHTTKNPDAERRIWAYPYKNARAMREAVMMRYSMIPYIYTMARKAYDTGVSILRPMYYGYPEQQQAYEVKDEYMFGDDIIARPVTTPMKKDKLLSSVNVWLPKGKWVEWYTGTTLEGGKTYKRNFQLDEIPLYVRQGAVIPMQSKKSVGQHESSPDPLVLSVFPGDTTTTSVYEDEGNSQQYEQGNFARTVIHHAEPNNQIVEITIDPAQGDYKGMPYKRAYQLRIMNSWPAASVTVNGQDMNFTDVQDTAGWWYDGQRFATTVRTPELSINQSTKITVHFARDIGDSRLNGMRGNIARLETARHTMQDQHHVQPPDTLTNLYQTGRRIELAPGNAGDELDDFWQQLPRIKASLSKQNADKTYMKQVMEELNDISDNAK